MRELCNQRILTASEGMNHDGIIKERAWAVSCGVYICFDDVFALSISLAKDEQTSLLASLYITSRLPFKSWVR